MFEIQFINNFCTLTSRLSTLGHYTGNKYYSNVRYRKTVKNYSTI